MFVVSTAGGVCLLPCCATDTSGKDVIAAMIQMELNCFFIQILAHKDWEQHAVPICICNLFSYLIERRVG